MTPPANADLLRPTAPAPANDQALASRFKLDPYQIIELYELDLERRPHNFHAMVCPELLQPGFLILRDFLPELAHVLEKILHAAGRLKENQHFSGPVHGTREL
jgi:hypothetical protein